MIKPELPDGYQWGFACLGTETIIRVYLKTETKPVFEHIYAHNVNISLVRYENSLEERMRNIVNLIEARERHVKWIAG